MADVMLSNKARKKLTVAVIIAAAAGFLALAPAVTGLLDRLEFATWSWRVKAFARKGPHTDRIKLILLDQQSLDWGKETMSLSWPWPREVYGPIIDFCRRGGARALAFDVLYTEPSKYGVADDEAMGAAVRRMTNFVAACFLSDKIGADKAWPETGATPILKPMDMCPFDASRALLPVPEIAGAAACLGDVRGYPDADGVVRSVPLTVCFDGKTVPSLGAASWVLDQRRRTGESPAVNYASRAVTIGESTFALNRRHRAVIRYRGKQDVYDTFSAAAVIQSELAAAEEREPPIAPSTVSNAFVLFGFSAPGLQDVRATSIDSVAPGVLVHAAVLDNMLTGDFMRVLPVFALVMVMTLLAFAASAGIVFCGSAARSVALFIVWLIVPVILAGVLYEAGYAFPAVQAELTAALALLGGLVYNYATEGRQKLFIKNAFKHYLSAQVIDQLLQHPDKLQLGGERRTLSIFFSDLQGFSSISEKLEPQELTALLNKFLSAMTDIILDEEGTLDKYEGDAIIAFWNAPLDQPDHAERACRAAVRCQRKLAEMRPALKERTGAELHMRVGIHTGSVVVGNMGSSNRFDYTILGDAANLASRLEGANKAFGTYTMVSQETLAAADRIPPHRCIGALRVVGRSTPVTVFELMAENTDATAYNEALTLLHEGEIEKAGRRFESIPNDPPAARYAQLCKDIQSGNVPWDGVWNLAEK